MMRDILQTQFPANSITEARHFQIPNQRLGNSSRTTNEEKATNTKLNTVALRKGVNRKAAS